MVKYVATAGALLLAAAFVIVFYSGVKDQQPLAEVAPRVGMSYDELMALGPRVASQSGATLGSSRHVVYLLACSGLSSKSLLEVQATQAGSMAREQLLSDREAVMAVLDRAGTSGGVQRLKNC